MTIKVVSVRQPWASLIACGLKGWETRSHKRLATKDMIAIASTKSQPGCMADILHKVLVDSDHDSRIQKFIEDWHDHPLPQGGIVAVVQFCSWYRMTDEQPERDRQIQTFKNNEWQVLIPAMTKLELACGKWQEGRYAGKLHNVAKTSFIPFKGSQVLQTLTDPAIAEVLGDFLCGIAGTYCLQRLEEKNE